MIRTDIVAATDGYLSDCARTAVVGDPTSAQKSIWEKFLELRQQAFELIKPGLRRSTSTTRMPVAWKRLAISRSTFSGTDSA